MKIRFGSPGLRRRNAELALVAALLACAAQLYGQSRTTTSSLTLQVHPEELLQAQSGSVLLKIRLARGTTARLWAANTCTSPSPQSHVITMSGVYSIPFSSLAAVSGESGRPMMLACLVSSDGALSDSVPIEVLGAGNSSGIQGATVLRGPGGILSDVPVGWAARTQAGTTTWSNP